MKPLELTCTLRNNRLKERRDALGISRRRLCELVGIVATSYGRLEAMKNNPKNRHNGRWTPTATKLAVFYRTTEEDLFPDVVLAVRNPEVARKIDEQDVQAILSSHQEHDLYLTPEDEVACREECRLLLAHEENTEYGCPDLVRKAFGIDGYGEMDLTEIADHAGRSRKNTQAKFRKSLRRMRANAERLGTR